MSKKELDLRSRVAAAILANPNIGQALIEVVEEEDGCITLRGNAASEQDKIMAENIAFLQDGIVRVVNEITCG